MNINIRLFCLLVLLAIVPFLFWLGEQPVAVGLISEPYDKLAHALMGAGLAFLFWFVWGRKYSWLTIGVVALLSGLDEWHQSFLPGRVPDFYDFLAATVAACLVVIFMRLVSSQIP